MTNPTTIYWGKIDAMIAEVAAHDPRRTDRKARYAVMPYGDAQWDTEGHATKTEAKADAKWIAEQYGIKAVFVG